METSSDILEQEETFYKFNLFSNRYIINENKKKEKILMFNKKNISFFKLYCHLSGSSQIFLTIIAVIISIIVGSSNAFIYWIFGDSSNALTEVNLVFQPKAGGFDPIDSDKKEEEEEEKKYENKDAEEEEDDDKLISEQIKKYLIVGSIMFICNILSINIWTNLALKQIQRLKIKYLNVILNQEQSWFEEIDTFELSIKVQSQFEQIEAGLGDTLNELVTMLSELISGFIVAFIASWKLSLMLLTYFPFIVTSILLTILNLKKIIPHSRKTYAFANVIAGELLYNIKTVASFVNFEYEMNRFNQIINKVEKNDKKRALISGLSFGISVFGVFVGYTVTLIYARKIIIDSFEYKNIEGEDKYIKGQSISIGEIQEVLFSVIGSLITIEKMIPNILKIRKSCLASSDYFTLYERKPKIYKSKKNLILLKDSIKGTIKFQNIKYFYPNDKSKGPKLNGFNLEIEEGKKVALIGDNYCGKNIIINLIGRLCDPFDGQILINDIDIKEYNMEYLRNLIGYIKNDTLLFNKSVKENIIFGRQKILEERGNQEKLMENVCKMLNIEEFILNNNDKYNFIIGINGNKLSESQKQLIGIARAILSGPKILILDQFASGLDNKCEKEILEAFENINKLNNITTLIITNKISILKKADIIYVLKDGEIIEKGTHQELLNKSKYYFHLIKSKILFPENHKEMKDIKYLKRNLSKKFSNKYIKIIERDKFEKEKKVIKGENIDIKAFKILGLISDHKLDLIIGILFSFIYGAGIPISGLFLAKVLVAFSNKDIDIIKNDGLKWSLFHLIIAIICGISGFLKTWKLEKIGCIITSKMRKKIFKKFLELNLEFYDIDYNSPSILLYKLDNETYKIGIILSSIISSIFIFLGGFIFYIILGMIYDWKLTLISFVFFPFILILTVKRECIKENGIKDDYDIELEEGSFIQQCIMNTKTIFLFNFEQNSIDLFDTILKKANKVIYKTSYKIGLFAGVGTLISFISRAVLVYSSFFFRKHNELTFENMFCALNCLLTIEGICRNLIVLSEFPKFKDSFRRLLRILEKHSKINAFQDVNKDKYFPFKFRGKIEFKNVSFAYPTTPKNFVLKDLSLVINEGEKAALVGYSGNGKSTILELIERFYDIFEGEILIDDISIKNYNLYELRKKTGLINQEQVHFKRSVYENIIYGKLDSDVNEVFDLAKNLGINIIFKNNKNEEKIFDTSKIEKLKIIIARTILKNPRILLLDEALLGIDEENEKDILKYLNEYEKGRTTIIVPHKLSTITNSEVIFYLEDGSVKEKGTHKELMDKKGKYYIYYKSMEKFN